MKQVGMKAALGALAAICMAGYVHADTVAECDAAHDAAVQAANAQKPVQQRETNEDGTRLLISTEAANPKLMEGLQGPILKRRKLEEAEHMLRACIMSSVSPPDENGNCPRNTRLVARADTDRSDARRNPQGESRVIKECVYQHEPTVMQRPTLPSYQNFVGIPVAFKGGSPGMRYAIMSIAYRWSWYTRDPNTGENTVTFDFGKITPYGVDFSEWSESDTEYGARIRISFDETDGYWSLIGEDSINPTIVRGGEPSMNLGGLDGYSPLPQDWRRTIYHEFGHALGLEHEHQHPSSVCGEALRLEDEADYNLTLNTYGEVIEDSAGRQPGVLTALQHAPNYWDREDALYNLAQLQVDDDRLTAAYDPNSIMKYEFPVEWYKDDAPPECKPSGSLATAPSPADYAMIRDTFMALAD